MLGQKSKTGALRARKKVLLVSAASVLGVLQAHVIHAQATLSWDTLNTPATPSGGAGTWSTNGTAFWSNGTADVVWNDSTGVNTAVFGGTAATVTLSGSDFANAIAFNTSGYSLIGGTLDLAGTTPTIYANSTTASISSAITASSGLTISGSGSVHLTGTTTDSVGTTVSSGTLYLGTTGAVGTGLITLNNANTGSSNTTLQYNVSNGTWTNGVTVATLGSGTTTIQYLQASAQTNWTPGTITLNGPATISMPNLTSYVFLGSAITGSGNLTIGNTNGNRFIWGNANDPSYTGNIEVLTGGILEPRTSLTSTIGNSVTVDSGGELRINYTGGTIDGLNGAGTVDSVSANGTLTVGKANGSGTFSGVMKNNGTVLTIIKTGGGTQTLTGANTYTGGTTINGGALQLGDGVTSAHDGTLSASGAITDNASLVYDVAGSSYSYSGTITGSGSITKTGPGNVTLSSADSYSGGTTVSAGKLYVNAAFTGTGLTSVTGGVLGGTGTLPGAVNVSTGGIEAGSAGAGTLTLNALHFLGAGTLNFGTLANYASKPGINVSGSTLYDPGSTAGAITINIGSLTNATPGTYDLLNYTGANADNGVQNGSSGFQYTLAPLPSRTAGTLSNVYNAVTGTGQIDLTIGAVGSLYLIWTGNGSTSWDTTTANNWNLSSGSSTTFITGDTVVFNDSANPRTTVSINSANVAPSSVTFNNNSSTYVLNGAYGITGVTGLTLNGTGTVQMNASNGFSGPVAVNAGIFNLQTSAALGTSTGTTIASGATLQLQNGITVAAVPLTISGAGAPGQNGALVNLGGSNTYTGPVTLGASATLSVNSGSLNLSNTGAINGSGYNLTLAGPAGTTGALAGSLQNGAGAVTKTGAGTWTLSGSGSNYSGGTTIRNGTLILVSTTAAGSGTITLNDVNTGSNNTTLTFNGTGTWANPITVANQGSGVATIQNLTTSGSFAWGTGTITLNQAATLSLPNITGYCTLNSVLAGNGNLTISSTHSQRLILNTTGSADSGFTGNIDVQSGSVFEPRDQLSAPGGNNVTVETGAELRIQFANTTINALNGSGIVDSVSGAATLTVGEGGGAGIFSGVMKNNSTVLSFAVAGGIETLEGSNTFTGGTSINGGTLQLGDGITSAHDGTLSPTGGINNNSALVYDVVGTSYAYAGAISGGGTVTQMGPGSVTLTGSNSYSGPTNVSAGRLYVNNASTGGGQVTVSGGATLGGTGTIAGNVNVSSGGIIEAGQNGLGSLTLNQLSFLDVATINVGNLANYNTSSALNAGTLSTTGAHSVMINVSGVAGITTNTPYELIGYTGGSVGGTGSGAFYLGTLPSRATGTLSDTGSQIDLTITGFDFLKWTGAGNLSNGWDSTTANWALNSSSGATTFNNNADAVVFDDSASASNTTVNMNSGNMNASSVTFNNSVRNYTLQGAYGIAGSTAVTLNGSANVLLNNTNSFTGGITLNGTGTLTLANSNSISGPVAINAGILNVMNGSLGTVSGVTIASGGTLQLQNGVTLGIAIPVTISGSGALNQSGALVNLNGNSVVSGLITLGNNATIAVNSGTFNLSNSGVINGTGFNLTLAGSGGTTGGLLGSLNTGGGAVTKNGGGTWILAGSNTYSGGTTVNGGTLVGGYPAIAFGGSAPGFGSGPIVVNAGATLTGNAPFTVTGGNQNTQVVTLNGGTWNMDYATTGGEYVNTLNMVGGTVSTTIGAFFRVPYGGLTIGSLASNTSSNITAGIDLTRNNIILNVAQGTVPNNQDLIISGPITQDTGITGGGPKSLTMNGNGTLLLSGNNSYTGGTIVNGGTLIFSGAGAYPAGGGLSIQSQGGNIPEVVSQSHSGGGATAMQVNGLSISGGTGNWTGLLDMTNNAMIVNGSSGSISQVTNQVAQGYNGGNWQGSGGITSSTAAADPKHLTALGAILNDNGTGSGVALYTTFESAPTVEDDILVKYTYYGDTDLNGEVDGSDYSRIDNAYGYNLANPGNPLTGWFNGDFNYDGIVDGSDYTLMDNTFNQQGATLLAAVATAQIGGSSAVPEPTTLGLLGLGAVGLLGRRTRRRTR